MNVDKSRYFNPKKKVNFHRDNHKWTPKFLFLLKMFVNLPNLRLKHQNEFFMLSLSNFINIKHS